MERNKKKYFVDSKGVCFLCLKYKSVENQVESGTSKQFSLRAISRYLDLDIWKLFEKLSSNDESLDKNYLEGEVLVNLCEQCSDLTSNCTQLFKVLEETKLLLDGCFHKILGVMEQGQRDPYRVGGMQMLLQDTVDLKQLEILREKIMLKCDRKLKIQGPRVIVSRLPYSNLKRDILPEVMVPEIVLKCEEVEDSNEDLDNEIAMESDCDCETAVNLPSTSEKEEDAPPSLRLEDLEEMSTSDQCIISEEKEVLEVSLKNSSQSDLGLRKLKALRKEIMLKCDRKSESFVADPIVKEAPGPASVTLKRFKRSKTSIDKIMLKYGKELKLKAPQVLVTRLPQHHLKEKVLPQDTLLPSKAVSEDETEDVEVASVSSANQLGDEEEATSLGVTNSSTSQATFNASINNPFIRESHSSPFICRYCNKVFHLTIRTSSLRHHLRVHHPSHYIPKVREMSNLPPIEFRTVLYRLLNNFIKDGNCSLCSKLYYIKKSDDRRQFLRTHLLQDHHNLLDVELSKPENISEFMKETNTFLRSIRMPVKGEKVSKKKLKRLKTRRGKSGGKLNLQALDVSTTHHSHRQLKRKAPRPSKTLKGKMEANSQSEVSKNYQGLANKEVPDSSSQFRPSPYATSNVEDEDDKFIPGSPTSSLNVMFDDAETEEWVKVTNEEPLPSKVKKTVRTIALKENRGRKPIASISNRKQRSQSDRLKRIALKRNLASSNRSLVQCRVCERTFETKDKQRYHEFRDHRYGVILKCEEAGCVYETLNKAKLRMHMNGKMCPIGSDGKKVLGRASKTLGKVIKRQTSLDCHFKSKKTCNSP